MSRKKIKNPLIKRIPKEIIGDWKKYLVVFITWSAMFLMASLCVTMIMVFPYFLLTSSMSLSGKEDLTYEQEKDKKSSDKAYTKGNYR